MLGIVLRVIAFIMFVVAAINETLFDQSPGDLIAWGLAAYVLADLVGGYDFGGRLSRNG